MSEQLPPDLTAPQHDAGWLFRSEMWLTNFIYGFWKHIIAVVLVGLVSVLVYGQYQTTYDRTQRQFAAQIASVERSLLNDLTDRTDPAVARLLHESGHDLRAVLQSFQDPDRRDEVMSSPQALQVFLWLNQVEPGYRNALLAGADGLTTVLLFTDGPDEAEQARIGEAAEALAAVAAEAPGAAQVEAWLRAADLYRVAGQREKQREALAAAEPTARGALRYTATVGLAHLDIESERVDEGLERLRALTNASDPFVAEQATLELAQVLEHLERTGEARQIYDSYLERFPEAFRAEEARMRRDRLAEASG